MGPQKTDNNMVKKELMLVVTLVTFVAGFLCGVVFSSFQSPQTFSPVSQQTAGPQGQQNPGLSPDQASRIMSLENEVSVNPQNVLAWTDLGNIYFDANRFLKSINAYEKALALDPNKANVWTDLGVMYRRSQQHEKALEAFDRAASLNPTHEQARFNRGIVLMYDMNDKAGAIKAWEELLTINPNATAPSGQSLREMIDSLE